ncbi:hypothetical protein MXMO3_03454 (plasmid) [Maritalea myrionectae]|uniref:Uncharacterized protein n=1 Tax=Maritalea myrionectae TaxID=454601 RepID=A0A2R4MIW6_9HYPH|nr:hypothetical protein [Maritalea myrionectae]AVX05957.1 hypothetical protein MXMO3_03454 [Maritalea myrionectae]
MVKKRPLKRRSIAGTEEPEIAMNARVASAQQQLSSVKRPARPEKKLTSVSKGKKTVAIRIILSDQANQKIAQFAEANNTTPDLALKHFVSRAKIEVSKILSTSGRPVQNSTTGNNGDNDSKTVARTSIPLTSDQIKNCHQLFGDSLNAMSDMSCVSKLMSEKICDLIFVEA